MKTKILIIFSLFILAVPLFAYAQVNPCSMQGVNQTPSGDKLSTLPRCINQIYVWSLGAGALLALLMMVVGGYSYMTAAGNAERASTGVDMIWSSIIGLGILFAAYLILRTINPDLVNFRLTQGFCVDQTGQVSQEDKASCTGDKKWYEVFGDNSTTPEPTARPR